MADLIQQKKLLREKMLAKRAHIPAAKREKANRRMADLMISLPEYQKADTIFVYLSVNEEPDTHALIEDAWKRNKRVCVPKCESLGIMHAYEIRGFEDLQPGKYHIPEPKDGCGFVEQAKIKVNLVPCVCCDVAGYRLGYGGGFYDRWLNNSSVPSALLCFGEMIVPEVPRLDYDQRIDILVSDDARNARRF